MSKIIKKSTPNIIKTESVDSITSDLNHRKSYRKSMRQAVSLVMFFGLVAGLAGGVFGSMLVVPWYQEHVLGQNPSTTSGEQTRIVLDDETAVTKVVEEVVPTVVSIVVTKDLPKYEQFGSPFGFFSDNATGTTENVQVGAGSGFIVTSDGLIVTNKHVVDDAEAEYTAVLSDSSRHPAKVIATDPFNDLAIVKIEEKDLPVVRLGDSSRLKLGQRVVAIGNALGEFQNTVTMGVVSGMNRNISAGQFAQTETLSEVIQTDTAINPGNSGGPLINLAGEVIGVNTAISSQAQLIGFAIPINQAVKVIDDVKKFGKVRRPFIGIRYAVITPNMAATNSLSVDHGIVIVSGKNKGEYAIVPGSPADKAGLNEGDIILEFDGVPLTNEKMLPDILRNYNPGDRVALKVRKQSGSETVVQITLDEAQ